MGGWNLTAGERLLLLLNGVSVSELLVVLEGGRGNIYIYAGGGVGDKGSGGVLYIFFPVFVPLTKNLLYKSYNDKCFSWH